MKKIVHQIRYWLPNLLLVLFAVSMCLLRIPNEMELWAEDAFYQSPDVIPEQIKIIAIDETTLDALGPYSEWNRSYFASLIKLLTQNPDKKPLVIGVDILFTGEGTSSGDPELIEAVEQAGNVVLASKLESSTRIVSNGDRTGYSLQSEISEEITAFERLSRVSDSGFTNAIFDEDGYIRRGYTYISTENAVYKSFAFQIAEKMAENPEALYENPSFVEFAYTGKPGDFETISMSDVLAGNVPADYFAGSVVLIGAYEEGMLDSYQVPITHSSAMYGVEWQANMIWALVNGKQLHTVPLWIDALLVALVVAGYGLILRRKSIRYCLVTLAGVLLFYPPGAFLCFRLSGYKLSLLYVPLGVSLEFLIFLAIRYVELQKSRALQMQRMLFSMADSMAEAIEGRTPYNANHTKNVAKRCLEMLDYINQMHKEKRTSLHFSRQDKNQMYLAAMLHDIGKMDIPLEVMDKPTKLGNREETLRMRLMMIQLRLERDSLTGAMEKEDASARIAQIQQFLEKLDGFNCGRPLREEELALIDTLGAMTYVEDDTTAVPYLTEEELADLHIRAGTLSEQERKIMQSHVVYTDKILNHMYFGSEYKDVRAIAANHHELLNQKGYPKGIGADQLDVMTRILTIMDIYDSLIADDRPYKKPKSVKVAFEILDEEAQAGKIDAELLSIAKEIWLTKEKM